MPSKESIVVFILLLNLAFGNSFGIESISIISDNTKTSAETKSSEANEVGLESTEGNLPDPRIDKVKPAINLGQLKANEPRVPREDLTKYSLNSQYKQKGFASDARQNFNDRPFGSFKSTASDNKRLYLDLLSFYLPDDSVVNPACQRDLLALDDGIVHSLELASKGILWPLKLVDSWGKFADGILEGNFIFMGSYNECLDISVHQDKPPAADFVGKYCSVVYQRLPSNNSGFDEVYRPSLKIPYLSVRVPSGLPALLYGTCMPSTCTEDELKKSLTLSLEEAGFMPSVVRCQTKHQQPTISKLETFGIFFFAFLGMTLTVASVLEEFADTYPESNLRNGPMRYLLVFSVPSNLKTLFRLETGKDNPARISCLHGIRFLSICWVVLGHQYLFSESLSSNLLEIPEIANKPAFQMIANGDLSVDTFFFMTGLLVCLITLKSLSRTGKFSVLYYYIHRIVRLLPSIVVCVVFLVTLSGLVVKGPLSWSIEDNALKGCRKHWWVDLTFVSNLIFPSLENNNQGSEWPSCMPHSWFLGVDTQLYMITPLIVLPLHFRRKKGAMLLMLWTAASVIIPATIIGLNHLYPSTMMIQDPDGTRKYYNEVYVMPWCRAGPYVIGIWTGYALHVAKDFPGIARMTKIKILSGWVATTTLALTTVFGIASYNKIADPAALPEIPMAVRVLYGGLHRALWGVVLAWIVLACQWGHGGPVNWFLSHPLWQPLSRLTYCIYLTSVPIQIFILSSSVLPTYYSNLTKIQETLLGLFLSIVISIGLHLVAEAPILRLEKLVLKTRLSARRPDDRTEATESLLAESADNGADAENPAERVSSES